MTGPTLADEIEKSTFPMAYGVFATHSTTTLGHEVVEVTAWVEPEPGDELEAAQAQKKKRGGRGKAFGPYELVKLMNISPLSPV